MGWASAYLEPLQRGETVSFRPRGNSMVPLIRSGQLCTVAPLGERTLEKGDIVLCRVGGAQYLHRILAVGADGRYNLVRHGRADAQPDLLAVSISEITAILAAERQE